MFLIGDKCWCVIKLEPILSLSLITGCRISEFVLFWKILQIWHANWSWWKDVIEDGALWGMPQNGFWPLTQEHWSLERKLYRSLEELKVAQAWFDINTEWSDMPLNWMQTVTVKLAVNIIFYFTRL